jgi:hypothetical protein
MALRLRPQLVIGPPDSGVPLGALAAGIGFRIAHENGWALLERPGIWNGPTRCMSTGQGPLAAIAKFAVLVGRSNENHSTDVSWMILGEEARHERPDGVSNHQERRAFACTVESGA